MKVKVVPQEARFKMLTERLEDVSPHSRSPAEFFGRYPKLEKFNLGGVWFPTAGFDLGPAELHGDGLRPHPFLAASMSQCRERSIRIVTAIDDFFYIETGSRMKLRLLLDTGLQYLALAYQCEAEKFLKYQCTVLSAKILGQEILPDRKYPTLREGGIAGGGVYRWLRATLHYPLGKRAELAASLLRLPRAALPLDSVQVYKTLVAHKADLSVPPPEREEGSEVGERFSLVKESIRTIVDNLDLKTGKGWVVPTMGATFNSSRADGGALGEILETVTPSILRRCLGTPVFIGYAMVKTEPEAMYIPDWMESIWHDVRTCAADQHCEVQVHVISEPCKARIITTEPGKRNQLARGYQKIIHSALRREDVFQLTGGPLTVDILNENFQGLPTRDVLNGFLASVDYSRATDALNGDLCTAYGAIMADRLMMCHADRRVFLDSLSNHRINYDTACEDLMGFGLPNNGVIEAYDQCNGQLMGSASSFPGLCIINLAILMAAWLAYNGISEASERGYRYVLSALRPLINGDDLIFHSPNSEFFEFWWKFASEQGLTPSPGKNYTSKDFGSLNSKLFTCVEQHREARTYYVQKGPEGKYIHEKKVAASVDLVFSMVDYFDSGLLRGQHKVQFDTRRPDGKDTSGTLDWAHVGVNYQTMMASVSDPGRRKRVHEVWFGNFRNELMKSDRSWRLPLILGGLGLPLGGATKPQLALANLVINGKADLPPMGEGRTSFMSTWVQRWKSRMLRKAGELLTSRESFCDWWYEHDKKLGLQYNTKIPRENDIAPPSCIVPHILTKSKRTTREFTRVMERILSKNPTVGPIPLGQAVNAEVFRFWTGCKVALPSDPTGLNPLGEPDLDHDIWHLKREFVGSRDGEDDSAYSTELVQTVRSAILRKHNHALQRWQMYHEDLPYDPKLVRLPRTPSEVDTFFLEDDVNKHRGDKLSEVTEWS
jgi:hypothetical protein